MYTKYCGSQIFSIRNKRYEIFSLKIFKVFLKQVLQIKININPKVFRITNSKDPLYF